MLRKIRLENFRNFESADLSFSARSIVFSGSNGQGKTSILESVFYLSNLRSFKTSQIKELRKIGTQSFKIEASIERKKDWLSRLEIETGLLRRLKIDSVPVSKASDFTGKIKTIAFLPDDPAIISGPAILRRRFADMFISMLDYEYFTSLQHYSSALKSRNFLLKSGKIDMNLIDSYNFILAEKGTLIASKKTHYITILSNTMKRILSGVRPELSDFEIKIRTPKDSFDKSLFLAKLESSFQRDLQKGFTSFGPHLDDFEFISDSKPLRIYGSQGQCRMASLCLKLAEYEVVLDISKSPNDTVVLVDDATNDLDKNAKNAFLSTISGAGQVFYAFTEVHEDEFFRDSQIFHISKGTVSC